MLLHLQKRIIFAQKFLQNVLYVFDLISVPISQSGALRSPDMYHSGFAGIVVMDSLKQNVFAV